MQYLLLALAFAIGCSIPLQAAINNQLKPYLDGSTIMAALVSFTVGTLALAVAAPVIAYSVAAGGQRLLICQTTTCQ